MKAVSTSPQRVGLKAIWVLAAPICAANLAVVCSGTIDTIMAGRLSADDLAGVALGIAAATWISISLAGVLQGIAPIAGFHYGAGEFRSIGCSLQQCVYLALFLSMPGVLLTIQTDMWTSWADCSETVAAIASQYLCYAALALPAILMARAFIAVNAAISRPSASMFVTFGMLACKVPLNWLLMFHFGFGGAGAGLSLCILSWAALSALVLIWRLVPGYEQMHAAALRMPSAKMLAKQLKIGFPIGLSIFFEMTSYTLMAIFIARLGTVALASHQIVANLVWLYYVLPFAVGTAGTVLVAQSLGAGEPQSACRAAYLSMGLATAVAIVVSGLTYLFRDEIASLYSPDCAVQTMATSFIVIVVWYHIADAVQCSGAAVLRGYRITFVPMLVHSLLLCGVGLFLGCWLAGFFDISPYRMGAESFWIGATVGLTLAAFVIGPFTLWAARRALHRRGFDAD